MYLKGIALSPHPPIIIPEIGMGRESEADATLKGMNMMSERIAQIEPQTIVMITPHGNVFSDGLCILDEDVIEGGLEMFSRGDVRFEERVDRALQEAIREEFQRDGISHIFIDRAKAKDYMVEAKLDHGCIVPLYYIQKKYRGFSVIHITIGMLDIMDMYRAGMALSRAIEKSKKTTVILASGDLSHRLSSDGPYSYSPKGAEFDREIVEALREGDFERALSIPKNVYEPAGECGYRSIAMALGAVDCAKSRAQIYSYEGPFGVGYMTGFIEILGKAEKSLADGIREKRIAERANRLQSEDEYIKLARRSIELWVNSRVEMDEQTAKEMLGDAIENMKRTKAAAFVSINKDGMLRGCMGTIEPAYESLAVEIVKNAIAAVSNDPRFEPVKIFELEHLDIKVDVLGVPERVENENCLDEKEYGVIVKSGIKKGVLLPDIEGIDSVQAQLEAVKKKAGIGSREKFEIYRFKVERHA